MNTIKVLNENNTAHIILARPQVHNALSKELMTELIQAFNTAMADEDVRCILLCGEGKNFCAGADLNWMAEAVKYNEADNLADAKLLTKLLMTIYECPKPVVAYVHGAVYGGGVGLVAACDVVYAHAKTKFCLSEVKLGLTPATISPFVSRAVGTRRAAMLALTAKVFNGQEAYEYGLVHELAADDEGARSLCQQMLSYGPQALAESKKLFQKHPNVCPESLDELARTIAKRRISKEGQEGVRAFLEKRQPSWLVDKE